MTSKYYACSIKWADDEPLERVTIKRGKILPEEDDLIFFYLEQDEDITDLTVENGYDFTVVDFTEY